MDIQEYQNLSGLIVSTSRQPLVYAQIQRAQQILETMLGYTLDPELVDLNEYEEIGKTQDNCPCACTDIDEDSLDAADDVEFAYRMFPYCSKDAYLRIDPCSTVHAVKLVKNGITYRTLEADDYRVDKKRGIIKFLEQCDRWCACRLDCTCVQLAVDADWLWPLDDDDNSTLPMDLLLVWADMATYYSNPKQDVRSETLGPHSYTKFDREKPETLSTNLAIIQRYAGPNGSVSRMPV